MRIPDMRNRGGAKSMGRESPDSEPCDLGRNHSQITSPNMVAFHTPNSTTMLSISDQGFSNWSSTKTYSKANAKRPSM